MSDFTEDDGITIEISEDGRRALLRHPDGEVGQEIAISNREANAVSAAYKRRAARMANAAAAFLEARS